jgi:hypothetical protein
MKIIEDFLEEYFCKFKEHKIGEKEIRIHPDFKSNRDSEKIKCIYFLIKCKEIIYIGFTTNLNSRGYFHSLALDFDYLIFYRSESAFSIEQFAIYYFKPKLNCNKHKEYEGYDLSNF